MDVGIVWLCLLSPEANGKRRKPGIAAGGSGMAQIPLSQATTRLGTMRAYPCPDKCSCHSAGPSTLPTTTATTSSWNRTAPALLLAALLTPTFAAPAPAPTQPDLPFLYPSLARRVTDAGQALDDPEDGYIFPENIAVEDLVRAGLPLKFVYDPAATLDSFPDSNAPVVAVEVDRGKGAWVFDDFWELHGKRFGPILAEVTADITEDPLPTVTQSASTTTPTTQPSPTTSSIPTVLAIKSSLPTGWGDQEYRRSGMYPIPIVVSFAVVIALMIGGLIGALVFRRGRRRRHRRKKERDTPGDDADDDGSELSLREKTARKGIAARVGRALRGTHNSEIRRRATLRHSDNGPTFNTAPDTPDAVPADMEQGQQEQEQAREVAERNDLERRVKSWARRSALWRVQARTGMRRRIGFGRRRAASENPADVNQVSNGDRDDAGVASRTTSRAPSPAPSEARSRASREGDRPPVVLVTNADEGDAVTATPTVPVYASPTVPTYSSTSRSGSQPGSSSSFLPSTQATSAVGPSHDAHPDATPGDEPAYDYGAGLPPAYRRGEGRAEVRRGKMPMRESDVEQAEVEPVRVERAEPEPREGVRGAWSALDAYAYAQEPAEVGAGDVTAHVATDDKQALERLRGMVGAPESDVQEEAEAPREEDVFEVEAEGLEEGQAGGSAVFPPPPENQTRVLPRDNEGSSPSGGLVLPPAAGALPSPPAKTGAGPVARYGEADLSLPRYLDGRGDLSPSAPPAELEPSAPPGGDLDLGASAPPEDDLIPSTPSDELATSAPALEGDDILGASAPLIVPGSSVLDFSMTMPSAPPHHEDDHPHSAPRLRHLNSSAPLHEGGRDDQ